MNRFVAPLFLAITLSTIGGCATVSKAEFEAVRATADRAAADAAAARSAADGAATAAAKAQSSADAAQSTAAAAKASAEEANACCRDTQTKIDRMFKKSMYK
jgi:murein lipoprotein